MRSLIRASELLRNCGVWAGGVCLVAMVVLTCSEIVARYFGQTPIKGSFELVGQLLIPITCFAIAYTQNKGGHIGIDLLVKHFPQRAQVIIELFAYFLCLGIFSLLTWQVFMLGMGFWDKHLVTETLGMPLAPFAYVAGVGCAMMCAELLIELIELLSRVIRK